MDRVSRLHVGEYFNPEMGFVRRVGVNKTFANLRLQPRSRSILVRKYFVEGLYSNISRATTGQSESRDVQLTFRTRFRAATNSTSRSITRPSRFGCLSSAATSPLRPVLRIQSTIASFSLGNQRPVYGSVGVRRVGFIAGNSAPFPIPVVACRSPRSSRLSRHQYQLDHTEGRLLFSPFVREQYDVYVHALDVRQRVGTVQLQQRNRELQLALPVGVSAGERGVRRLLRRA